MINFLLRRFMWKQAARLFGRKATRNARSAQRAVRLAQRFRR